MVRDRLPPSSPARRHFMGIVAAGAGKLSTIAISSSLLVEFLPDGGQDWPANQERR